MKTIYWLVGLISLAALGAGCVPVHTAVPNTPASAAPASTQTLAVPVRAATAAADTPPAPTPASAEAAVTLMPVSPPAVLVSLSGAASAVSEKFSLPADGAVKVYWSYTGRGHFAVWLVNVSEELSDPAYDRQLVVDVTEASVGAADFQLIAGDYTLEVEEAAGPWVIAVDK